MHLESCIRPVAREIPALIDVLRDPEAYMAGVKQCRIQATSHHAATTRTILMALNRRGPSLSMSAPHPVTEEDMVIIPLRGASVAPNFWHVAPRSKCSRSSVECDGEFSHKSRLHG
ncbi:hypothetical protein DAEQUDRAFT_163819 [Daedalea quercina L-15889]|uniref:Uncharacterized protein n=1 Tax=Daedalea quercina L-15889 TaxID=1314783 RepID=A0A165RH38_9APHY|nr:hypothetical protein DAEQUDRAFT_163819 [Daedalea quercina L-15889]